MLKNALDNAAKYESLSLPGDGRKKYTAKIMSAVKVHKPIVLDVKKEDLRYFKVFCDTNGIKNGAGKKVWKTFPIIEKWGDHAEYIVTDDVVTDKILLKHLNICGYQIGLGSYRPEKGGDKGMFVITAFEKVSEIEEFRLEI